MPLLSENELAFEKRLSKLEGKVDAILLSNIAILGIVAFFQVIVYVLK